jgi:16S rRNA processing protein RimM
VTGVDDHGAHAILKLAQTVAGKRTERLIPFVGVYVLTVDLVARRIHVDWEQDY